MKDQEEGQDPTMQQPRQLADSEYRFTEQALLFSLLYSAGFLEKFQIL